MGAALVLVQAARLGLDRLEHELFEAARAMGMPLEAIAAVLDLPDAAAAEKRQRWLEARRALPYATAESQRPEADPAARRAEAAHWAKSVRAKSVEAPSARTESGHRREAGQAAGGAGDDPGEQRP